MEKEKSLFHTQSIQKGVYGELSKISEELQEAYDAEKQGQDLMLLIELSDMIGAIAGVAEKYGMTIEQLHKFSILRSKVAIEELKEEKDTPQYHEKEKSAMIELLLEYWRYGGLEQSTTIKFDYQNTFDFLDLEKYLNRMKRETANYETFEKFVLPRLSKMIKYKG